MPESEVNCSRVGLDKAPPAVLPQAALPLRLEISWWRPFQPITSPEGIEVRYFKYLLDVWDFEFFMRGFCRYGHLYIVFRVCHVLKFSFIFSKRGNFQVAAATATSQELSQSGKSPDTSSPWTKYPVQESLTWWFASRLKSWNLKKSGFYMILKIRCC